MDDTIPGVAGIVYNNVDLAIAKFSRLLDKLVDILIVEHVTWNGQSFASIVVDRFRNSLCLFCMRSVSCFVMHVKVISHTAVNVRNDNLCTLIRK